MSCQPILTFYDPTRKFSIPIGIFEFIEHPAHFKFDRKIIQQNFFSPFFGIQIERGRFKLFRPRRSRQRIGGHFRGHRRVFRARFQLFRSLSKPEYSMAIGQLPIGVYCPRSCLGRVKLQCIHNTFVSSNFQWLNFLHRFELSTTNLPRLDLSFAEQQVPRKCNLILYLTKLLLSSFLTSSGQTWNFLGSTFLSSNLTSRELLKSSDVVTNISCGELSPASCSNNSSFR